MAISDHDIVKRGDAVLYAHINYRKGLATFQVVVNQGNFGFDLEPSNYGCEGSMMNAALTFAQDVLSEEHGYLDKEKRMWMMPVCFFSQDE